MALMQKFLVVALAVIGFTTIAVGQKSTKAPIIIIPGLTGSELVNDETGELVWFKPSRSKDDDIRLPISPVLVRNRDKLVPKDIIRAVQFAKWLPEVEIYSELINALEKRAGYVEGKWDDPPEKGYESTFYVFAYDWRRDNVENARSLVQKIESLKRKLGKPDLKFNIVAHSMGGLISRYAAMYGNADISKGMKPNWAGAKHLDRIFLLGTPNEGSIAALDAMLNGYSYFGRGINIPFVRDISRFDVFTIPSMFELLPQNGALRIFDENLKPLKIDLYDPKTWDEYGWNIWDDNDFRKKFDFIEQEQARPYFRVVLRRAKDFQAALNASSNIKPPVSFYLIGAECKDTLDAAVLYRKKDRWKLIFSPDSFERSDGTKVPEEQVRRLIIGGGDGVVPISSLKAEHSGGPKNLPVAGELHQCESHAKLVTNPDIQDRLFALLFGGAIK